MADCNVLLVGPVGGHRIPDVFSLDSRSHQIQPRTGGPFASRHGWIYDCVLLIVGGSVNRKANRWDFHHRGLARGGGSNDCCSRDNGMAGGSGTFLDAGASGVAGNRINRAERMWTCDALCLGALATSMEKQMSRITFLRFWSIAVGSMDALTGVFLIVAPAQVLRMLGISPPSPDALVFLSWMGVFVLGVGLSYALALGRRSCGETVWIFTALVRMLVSLFLAVKILAGVMPMAWSIVAFSDGLVAVAQMVILRLGWWKGAQR